MELIISIASPTILAPLPPINSLDCSCAWNIPIDSARLEQDILQTSERESTGVIVGLPFKWAKENVRSKATKVN